MVNRGTANPHVPLLSRSYFKYFNTLKNNHLSIKNDHLSKNYFLVFFSQFFDILNIQSIKTISETELQPSIMGKFGHMGHFIFWLNSDGTIEEFQAHPKLKYIILNTLLLINIAPLTIEASNL